MLCRRSCHMTSLRSEQHVSLQRLQQPTPTPIPPPPERKTNKQNPRHMWLLQIDMRWQGGRRTGALVSAASSAERRRSLRQKNRGFRAAAAARKGGEPTRRLISSRASGDLGVVLGGCVIILDIICFLLMLW